MFWYDLEYQPMKITFYKIIRYSLPFTDPESAKVWVTKRIRDSRSSNLQQ